MTRRSATDRDNTRRLLAARRFRRMVDAIVAHLDSHPSKREPLRFEASRGPPEEGEV